MKPRKADRQLREPLLGGPDARPENTRDAEVLDPHADRRRLSKSAPTGSNHDFSEPAAIPMTRVESTHKSSICTDVTTTTIGGGSTSGDGSDKHVQFTFGERATSGNNSEEKPLPPLVVSRQVSESALLPSQDDESYTSPRSPYGKADKAKSKMKSTMINLLHDTVSLENHGSHKAKPTTSVIRNFQQFFGQLDKDDQTLVQISAHLTKTMSEEDWNVQHTLSYWVAIFFIYGSITFTSGSIFWLYELNSAQGLALVSWPFWLGAISFGIGSYITWWENINFVPDFTKENQRPNKIVWVSFKNRTLSWWACFNFVIGATLYLVATTCEIGLFELPESMHAFAAWNEAVAGVFFTIGGYCEMVNHKWWKLRLTKLGWWVSWFNGIGGLGFGLAGVFGVLMKYDNNPDPQRSNSLGCKWCFVWGSAFYLFGGIGSLAMWKTEQFGLAFMPELNFTPEHKKKNTVSIYQLPFLVMYVVTAAVATSGAVLAYCQGSRLNISNMVLAFLLPLGILLLGSVIHRVPEKPPYSYLLWFLRFIMFWFTINLTIDSVRLSEPSVSGNFKNCPSPPTLFPTSAPTLAPTQNDTSLLLLWGLVGG